MYDYEPTYTEPDYRSVTDAPWGCYNKDVKTVIIGEGITKIGRYSFCGMSGVYTVEIPSTVTRVCMSAFEIEKPGEHLYDDSFDMDVYYNGTEDDWYRIQFEDFNNPVTRGRIWSGILLPESGKCGVNTYWSYDEKTATLTVSGNGAMQDFSITGEDDEYFYVDIPWSYYLGDIKNIVIEDGVTVIGDIAFLQSADADSVTLPASLVRIGTDSFFGCEALRKVSFLGNNIEWGRIEAGEGNEPLLSAEITFSTRIVPGDINGDSKVNATDSNMMKKMVLGIMEGTNDEVLAADINRDGKINAADSNLITKIILGIIDVSELPG